MPDLTILKLGGSVLRTESDLRLGVHGVYRWLRDSGRVVVVVSAFEGVTDALLKQAQAYEAPADCEASRALVSTGEITTASLLTLSLQKAGIPARLLTPHQIGLRTEGAAEDAQPRTVNRAAIHSALEDSPLIVIPGFLGVDADQALTLLGRGGSDLTALFLAAELGATRCRLLKDVDGLYERDPALPGPAPRRYANISWSDALTLDGGIVQHKAVRLARDRALSFEVGALGQDSSTRVSAAPSTFAPPALPERRLHVVMLGAGTVGGGVLDLIQQQPALFRVKRIAVRDVDAAARRGLPPHLLTNNALAAVNEPCDIVIELMGGLEPAHTAVRAALSTGKHVITANKLLIAQAGDELHALARRRGIQLLYSAAVGGAVPMLETVRRISRAERITSIEGVVNGTTNFVLDQVIRGAPLCDALSEARRLGFAEADPTADLHGHDAAHKLCLLARAAGHRLHLAAIRPDQLTQDRCAHLRAECDGSPTRKAARQVASIRFTTTGPQARVDLRPLATSHPLAACTGPGNVLLIHTESGATHRVNGIGAGRWPTSESVYADLLDLTRRRAVSVRESRTPAGTGPNIAPFRSSPVSEETHRCEQPNSVPALA